VAGSKLCQFILPHFEAQAEHIEVEPFQCRWVRRAEHNVIDPNNLEGCRHGKLLFRRPNRSYSRAVGKMELAIGGTNKGAAVRSEQKEKWRLTTLSLQPQRNDLLNLAEAAHVAVTASHFD
jgi:hypothetical protein